MAKWQRNRYNHRLKRQSHNAKKTHSKGCVFQCEKSVKPYGLLRVKPYGMVYIANLMVKTSKNLGKSRKSDNGLHLLPAHIGANLMVWGLEDAILGALKNPLQRTSARCLLQRIFCWVRKQDPRCANLHIRNNCDVAREEEPMFRWLRQKFCKHAYRKHWNRDAGGYVMRCVKCEKEVARGWM